jgi:hypothetical protein
MVPGICLVLVVRCGAGPVTSHRRATMVCPVCAQSFSWRTGSRGAQAAWATPTAWPQAARASRSTARLAHSTEVGATATVVEPQSACERITLRWHARIVRETGRAAAIRWARETASRSGCLRPSQLSQRCSPVPPRADLAKRGATSAVCGRDGLRSLIFDSVGDPMRCREMSWARRTRPRRGFPRSMLRHNQQGGVP